MKIYSIFPFLFFIKLMVVGDHLDPGEDVAQLAGVENNLEHGNVILRHLVMEENSALDQNHRLETAIQRNVVRTNGLIQNAKRIRKNAKRTM